MLVHATSGSLSIAQLLRLAVTTYQKAPRGRGRAPIPDPMQHQTLTEP